MDTYLESLYDELKEYDAMRKENKYYTRKYRNTLKKIKIYRRYGTKLP